MRERVEAVARQLGYRPNLIARSLITRRSNIVGVGIGYMDNQFYPKALEALSEALSAAGYRALLFTARPGSDSDPMLEEILHYRVDAVVLASAMLSSHLAHECRQAGVPVVLMNRKTDDAGVSSVTGDNQHGAALIAEYLIAGGHRRYGFIAGLEESSTSRDREAGFASAMHAAGLPAPLRDVGHYDFAGAGEAMRRMLSTPDRPDAVFCANDHMAMSAIDVARIEFGLQVGRDISIIGFDDVTPATWPSYDLTTYSQPVDRMIVEVMRLITSMLSSPAQDSRDIVVPGELIVRGSARRPAFGIQSKDHREIWSPTD